MRATSFFNKNYNLVYGQFLKQLIKHNVKLKYHGISHLTMYIKKITKIIDELYDTKLSDNEDLNKQLHKKIFNISAGMLEQSHNTSQKNSVFSSLKEACHNQRQYPNSKIYTISKCQLEWVEVDEDSSQLEEYPVGETYYVLNVADKKVLSNGFIYIKELLLQYHNFKMYEAYKTMTDNNVKVYSVKTDAFVIHEHDLDKVVRFQLFGRSNGLLKGGNEIGDWRIEDKTHIQLPPLIYI